MTEQLIMAGQRREADDGSTFEVLDPSTGEGLTTVAKAGRSDADRALGSAESAFDQGRGPWARTSARDRGRVLHSVCELIRGKAEELAALETAGAGHPISSSRWEVEAAATTFEYYAGAATKHLGSVVPVADPGLSVVTREPVGPAVLIVPWNFPLLIAAWKVAPALAAGNPVILKPASLTPLTALALGDILVEAGVPPEQVTVLPGPGSTLGAALVEDPRAAKISFTGETTTGASILRASADNIARVSLELGGKSAAIVFADCDADVAINSIPMSVFDNAGQDCCSRSRILVERSLYDRFVAGFAEATSQIVVGTPSDEATQMGPLISQSQRQTSLDYIEIGADEGAEHVVGGNAIDRSGFFMTPAVLAGVDNQMRVAREEIFGPVACIIPFDDEDHAVALANDSDYGLSGSLWTGSATRAIRVSRQLRTGTLSVNSSSAVRVEAPFGGFKRSGLGRELGMSALDSYTEVKSVFFAE